jgi:membrane fusion protein, multidrug efflux system
MDMVTQSGDVAADTGEEKRSSPLSNPKVRLGLLILAVIVAGGVLWWYLRNESYGKYQQSTNDAFVQADSVIVAPRVGGYVERVFVQENAEVRRGQQLALLDNRDYRAQTSQLQAQIEAARASANTVQAQIAEQQADLAFANREVARYRPLAASGAEPRERLDQLVQQQQQARAQLATRQADLLAAQRRFGTLRTQVEQARSQGRAAEAQLEAANVTLESTVLRSSIAGRVGDLAVRVGQFVQPGTRLMTIVPTQQLYIEANFKETQVGLMRAGQPVRVEVDALPGLELTGRVASFAPGTGAQFSVLPPQNATGNFTKIVQRIPVRIAIQAGPEVRRLLIPGMSVHVTVDTRGAKGELERVRQAQEGRR